MISEFGDLKLLQLSLRDIGPFREQTKQFRFMGTLAQYKNGKRRDEAPANLYMLFAMNGRGKTTVLRSIYSLMDLLGRADGAVPSLFRQDCSVQLDLRVTLTVDGVSQVTLVSIWYGSDVPLVDWSDRQIEEIAQASKWAKIGFRNSHSALWPARGMNELGQDIYESIQHGVGVYPHGLFGTSSSLPSVLFFPADRSVSIPVGNRSVVCPNGWGYQSAQIFNSDGPAWESSVESVLVWLDWLDDGRLDDLLKFVNDHVFYDLEKSIRRPRREELTAYVSTNTNNHVLGELSHGELALLQLYVRILCHMTENSVILIDEIENHLHTKWMNRFFQALKTLIIEVPSLSVVFTTHNRELMRVFNHTRLEKGLVKGGHLIEEGMD